jgi:hypothetical protein
MKNQFVPHRRHYVSATEHKRLMVCTIWGFYGSDYEEWRLLRYKDSIRTSQEAQVFSAVL